MAKYIGISEAKDHLSALVDEAANGAEIVITRRGKPVVRLAQCAPSPDENIVANRRQALLEIRSMVRSRGQQISIEEIKSWIDEGRP